MRTEGDGSETTGFSVRRCVDLTEAFLVVGAGACRLVVALRALRRPSAGVARIFAASDGRYAWVVPETTDDLETTLKTTATTSPSAIQPTSSWRDRDGRPAGGLDARSSVLGDGRRPRGMIFMLHRSAELSPLTLSARGPIVVSRCSVGFPLYLPSPPRRGRSAREEAFDRWC